MGSVKVRCASSTRVPNPVCKNHFPHCYPRTSSSCRQCGAFFCPVQASGANVSYDDLQKPYVSHIGSFACPGIVLSSLSQCSVSRLLSNGRRHRCPSRGGLVMASLFVNSFCVHVISCWRCGCVFRFVWRARVCNSARCSSAHLRRRPPTNATFQEVLRNPGTTTRELLTRKKKRRKIQAHASHLWPRGNDAFRGQSQFCLAQIER